LQFDLVVWPGTGRLKTIKQTAEIKTATLPEKRLDTKYLRPLRYALDEALAIRNQSWWSKGRS
jgi:hypothetical protein